MNAKRTAGGGTRAVRFLEDRGIAHRLHRYAFDPGDLGIGEQAAEALGVAPERIFKTLMVTIDERRLAIALVPVHCNTDLRALAAALGGKRAALADLAQAERRSGYVKGGISPFGQRHAAPVVVDTSILCYDSVLVNGGRRGLQIELSPQDLIATLDAEVAAIARGPGGKT